MHLRLSKAEECADYISAGKLKSKINESKAMAVLCVCSEQSAGVRMFFGNCVMAAPFIPKCFNNCEIEVQSK